MQTAPKGWFQHNQVRFFLAKKNDNESTVSYAQKKKHRLLKQNANRIARAVTCQKSLQYDKSVY